MRLRDRRGFSLIELMIAMAILGMIVLMVYEIMENSASAYARDTARQTLQDNARRVLDDIAAELRYADRDNVIIPASPNNTSITFRKIGRWNSTTKTVDSFVGGVPIWSDPIVYRYEASDVDANSNGLKDEGRLVRQGPNEKGAAETIKKCDYLRPNGITFTRTGDHVVVALSLFSVDGRNRILDLTLQTSVALRNRP